MKKNRFIQVKDNIAASSDLLSNILRVHLSLSKSRDDSQVASVVQHALFGTT
jgi:hypothetical protein